ncbi:MAG: hypothetical protein ACKV2Q_27085 [Planctomycetaceae bacterium]
MTTETELPDLKLEESPFGKVIGIVESRAQLQAVTAALSALGVQNIEVLDGAAGIKSLDGEQDAVANCFLGDMEADMVQRYRDAVKNGQIVFTAVVEPESADEAAEAVKAQGATEIAHFGTWMITNY